MGKANFTQIYQDATDALGERPRIKVSYWCDKFRKDANYAGFIVYHTYGSFEWKQREGQGLSGGHRGRSFYVLLLCTDNWPESAMRDVGHGRVHDYLYRQYFAMEYSAGKTCCGGFAVLKGVLRYSSIWLNMQASRVGELEWTTDGDKNLSHSEQNLVQLGVGAWMRSGPGVLVDIPDEVDRAARSGTFLQGPIVGGLPTPEPTKAEHVSQMCGCSVM